MGYRAIVLLLFAFVVLQCSRCGKVNYITTGNYYNDGYAFNGDRFDFSNLPVDKSQSVTCTIINPTVKGSGASFYRYAPENENLAPLNLTIRGATVTNASFNIFGNYSNLRMEISGTLATMEDTTDLFVFDTFYPYINSIVNILQTTVTWPASAAGGSVFLFTGNQYLHLSDQSGFYLTWTHATNAAQVWYLKPTDDWIGWKTNYPYYANIAGIIAVDYTTCVNCKNAFLNAVPGVAPFAGSVGAIYRISNSTMIGGTVFWRSSKVEMFGIGGYWANLILSGIYTQCPLFLPGSYGFIQGTTSLTMMHMDVPSIGLNASDKLFPQYTYKGRSDNNAFMGNITVGGVFLEPTIETYRSYRLDPTVILDNYSIVVVDTKEGIATFTVGQPAPAYCTYTKYTGSSLESLGPTGMKWTRAQCDCVPNTLKPYCTRIYDPMLYYAGYTFNPPPCELDDCITCVWGFSDQCNRCAPQFMLSKRYKCVPNICGECPTDGKIYTYTEGICVQNNISNCATVNSAGACVACNESYTLYNKECMLCTVENCALCSSDNYCLQCNSDQSFVVSEGKCVYCGDNCMDCTTTGCKKCSDGYNVSATTGQCAMVCSLVGCTKCKSSTECETCDTGLTLTAEGTCSCNIDHCEKCFGDKCYQCATGYYYNILNYTCDVLGPSKSSDDGERTRVAFWAVALLTSLAVLATTHL